MTDSAAESARRRARPTWFLLVEHLQDGSMILRARSTPRNRWFSVLILALIETIFIGDMVLSQSKHYVMPLLLCLAYPFFLYALLADKRFIFQPGCGELRIRNAGAIHSQNRSLKGAIFAKLRSDGGPEDPVAYLYFKDELSEPLMNLNLSLEDRQRVVDEVSAWLKEHPQ